MVHSTSRKCQKGSSASAIIICLWIHTCTCNQEHIMHSWCNLKLCICVYSLIIYFTLILTAELLEADRLQPVEIEHFSELFEADRLQPVEIEYFSEHIKNMHKNRDRRFEQEYQVSADVHFQGWKGSAWGIPIKIIYHHYTSSCDCTNLTLYL